MVLSVLSQLILIFTDSKKELEFLKPNEASIFQAEDADPDDILSYSLDDTTYFYIGNSTG